jgi:hypothetical protein
VIDFAGIDQVSAFAPADIEPVPFFAVERKASDRSDEPFDESSSLSSAPQSGGF